jgi:hypothetical protein
VLKGGGSAMGFDYEDETARWRGGWAVSAEASDRLGPWMSCSSGH